MKYLGIDIGGSFIKSAVLDTQKFKVREIKKIKSPDFIPSTNTLIKENNPDEILEAIKQIIYGYIKSNDKIEGIFFSTQMHGFILMDEQNNCITNYITWQDERSTEKMENSDKTYLDFIKKSLDAQDVKKSGTHIKPSLGMCNLYHWLNNNKPDQPLWFCTLGDYLIVKLTGEKPVCHITNAASTGMVDIEMGDWNKDIIQKLGFGNIMFPEIIHENTVCGVYKTMGSKIRLYPAVADHQAAMYGSLLTPEKDIAINIGTGSQICIVSEQPIFGEYELRPFFEGNYLKTICHIPAGRALNVLIDFISDIGSKIYGIEMADNAIWEKIDIHMQKVMEIDVDVNISFFKTSAVPYGGAVKNISEHNLTVENLFYGALKNMVQNYYDLHSRMIDTDEKIQRVVCAGGLVRKNPMLMDMLQKKFGLPCSLTPYAEDTLIGLLRLAQSCE